MTFRDTESLAETGCAGGFSSFVETLLVSLTGNYQVAPVSSLANQNACYHGRICISDARADGGEHRPRLDSEEKSAGLAFDIIVRLKLLVPYGERKELGAAFDIAYR